MDKETLSNYGWIVILVLILSVLLALATPFGNFIAGAIKATTAGFFSVNQGALGAAGIHIPGQDVDDPFAKKGYAVFDNGDGTTTTLTWDELMLAENGEKYDYDASSVSDTVVGEDAFENCCSLLSISFPSSITTIGNWAFDNCESLTTVDFSGCSSLTYIGPYAFAETESLIAVDLSECINLITVDENAFFYCESIEYLKLPSSLNEILMAAFKKCYNLTDITYAGTTAQWNVMTFGPDWNWNSPATQIHCSDGTTCATHTGGIQTCQNKAICEVCNQEYGLLAPHCSFNGACKYCGIAVEIETAHSPYTNGANYAVLGTWDYSDAKSVNITITYQTENAFRDWVMITKGTDYVSGSSCKQTREYLTTSGGTRNCFGTGSYVDIRFGGTTKKTVTFENINMLTGSVVFRSDNVINNYYGVKVVITPNY